MGAVYFTREIIESISALRDIAYELKRMNDFKEMELKATGKFLED